MENKAKVAGWPLLPSVHVFLTDFLTGPRGQDFMLTLKLKTTHAQGLGVDMGCHSGGCWQHAGPHSVDLSFHDSFLGNIHKQKENFLQTKHWYSNSTSQMGRKYLKLRVDVSGCFSFCAFFHRIPQERIYILLRELWSSLPAPPCSHLRFLQF